MTLRHLMLDDIRIAGPNRDEAEAFDPSETWATACERINEGHPVATVADLLLDLDDNERGALADYWRDHTLNTRSDPALDGRDFNCPDIRLALAMQAREPDCDHWCCAPTLDPESLWETVREFDRLKAAIVGLRAALDRAIPVLRLMAMQPYEPAAIALSAAEAALARAEGAV